MSYLLNGSDGGYAITTHLLYPLCHRERERERPPCLDGDGEDNHPFKVSLLLNLRGWGWGRREEDKVVFAW